MEIKACLHRGWGEREKEKGEAKRIISMLFVKYLRALPTEQAKME